MPQAGRVGFAALLLLSLPVRTRAQDDDLVRYLRSIEVKAGESLPDVVCVGCSVRVAGIVTGDVVAVAGDVEITGTIEGDAVAAGGRVRLLPGGSVEGEAVAVGGVVSLEGAAAPKGGVESVPYFHFPGQRSFHPLGILTFLGVNCLAAVIGGLILRERRCTNLADSIVQHPLSTTLIGVVVTTLWFVLWSFDGEGSRTAQIAAWTAQGVVFILLFCGCTGIAWLAGRLIVPRLPFYVQMLEGAFIVSIVLLVPAAGAILLVVATVLAFGAAVVSALGTDAYWIGRRRRNLAAHAREAEP